MTFTYAECFAGAGGMSLGFERAGMACRWHAEIADFPRRVLTHHWPDTPLYGDVAALDGHALVRDHGPITLLSGGAPCQDLSVAGKRLGFKGERSVLYFELVRLWDETQAPYFLYENVAGALSSNAGADFAAVLSAIVGGTVPVPADGWRGAGVVSGPTGVAAWRLLDAQWFGVPQRRLRVFVLGARAGGCDPAEVLLEPQGVRGHPPTRGEAGEGTARDAGARTAEPLGWDAEGNPTRGVAGALSTHHSSYNQPGVLSFGWQNAAAQGADVSQGSVAPLRTGTTPAVVAYDTTQVTSPQDRSNPKPGAPCHTLASKQHPPLIVSVTGEITHALTHEGHDASEDGTGRGTPIVSDYCADVCDTLDTYFGTKLGLENQHINSGAPRFPVQSGIPRRLMPVECERLMSWPDGWTDIPDEKGKPASDAVRYKAAGNGVVSNVAQWIGERLMACHSALRAAA